LVQGFQLRQAVLLLDEWRELTGATREVTQELRSQSGFRGTPIPLRGLETRAGETTADGVPDPIRTMPIIDRLFAPTVASKMGVEVVQSDAGAVEYPVVSSAISAGWQATELANVPGPTTFTTMDRVLRPDHGAPRACRPTCGTRWLSRR